MSAGSIDQPDAGTKHSRKRKRSVNLPERFLTTYSTHTTKEKGEPRSGGNRFRLFHRGFKQGINLA